ncbi:allatostatin-A receptor-like [Chironomus tepperi]|uniref:allatostatin-A receptor-like n=1 Tax=Chironomus tepperi TaxID=113505 RepID=UPI00391F5E25
MSELQFPDDFISTSRPSPEELEGYERLEHIVSIVVPIFFSLIGITGFIGNLLVIITVVFNQQMRNTTNLLILNLSFADLLFICFCIPFTGADYSLSFWPFGNFWCKTVQYLIICTAYISIYTLVLMSLDRYLAVCFPVNRIRSERNTILSIILIWGIVLAACIPVFNAHGIFEYTDNGRNLTSCTFTNDDFMTWSTFHISFFTSSYCMPLFFISFLYILMLLRLWKSNLAQSAESKRGKKRVTRLVIVIVACFAILWFPIQLILLLKSLDYYKAQTHWTIAFQICAHILAYASSCVNPLLYAFLSENFRKSFRKIIYCHPSSHSRYLPTATKFTATGTSGNT